MSLEISRNTTQEQGKTKRENMLGNSFSLIFIRHGQSDANITPEHIGGRCPLSELTTLGVEQAQKVGQHIKTTNLKIDRVFCSPLLRSTETAKICLTQANRVDLLDKVYINDLLEEFSQGEWEHQERSLIYTPETEKLVGSLKTWFTPPGGESLRSLKNRASMFVENEILDKYWEGESVDGEQILVFGHGIWFKMLLMEILGLDQICAVNLHIDNCSLSRLDFGPKGWSLVKLNQTF